MLPRKKRREIIVDDVLYYYRIQGHINVVIQNSVTNEIIKWNDEWKPKWRMQLKPSDIENVIRKHNERMYAAFEVRKMMYDSVLYAFKLRNNGLRRKIRTMV